MWKYKIGESAAILDCINEALHNEGFIDDETYQKFKERYLKPLLDIVREKEQPSVKFEVKSAKLEVQVVLFKFLNLNLYLTIQK